MQYTKSAARRQQLVGLMNHPSGSIPLCLSDSIPVGHERVLLE